MKPIALFFSLAVMLVLGNSTAMAMTIYTGDWFNNTFGSTGPAAFSVEIDVPGDSFSVIMDLDGAVFGGSDPGPASFSGLLSTGVITPFSDPVFGDTTGAFDVATGNFSGRNSNLPDLFLDHATFGGTLTSTQIIVNYSIFSGPNETGDLFAEGVISASTTVVPLPAAAWLLGTGIFCLIGFGRRKQLLSS